MSTIRARRGNTVLALSGMSLHVRINADEFGPFVIEARAQESVWSGVQRIDIPLTMGNIGVGGLSSEVAIELGGTNLSFEWWMAHPRGWDSIAAVFDALAALVPAEVRRRYDFAQGGE